MKSYRPGDIHSAEVWHEWSKGEKTDRWLIRTNTGANFIVYTGPEGFIRVASPCCGQDIGIANFSKDEDGVVTANFACDNCDAAVTYFDDAETPRVNMIPGSQLSTDGVYVGDWPLLEFLLYFVGYFSPPLEAIAIGAELEAIVLEIIEENTSNYKISGKKDLPLAFTLAEVR